MLLDYNTSKEVMYGSENGMGLAEIKHVSQTMSHLPSAQTPTVMRSGPVFQCKWLLLLGV